MSSTHCDKCYNASRLLGRPCAYAARQLYERIEERKQLGSAFHNRFALQRDRTGVSTRYGSRQ